MRFGILFLLLLAACNKEEPQKTPDQTPGFFVGVKPVNVVRTPFPPANPLAEMVLTVSFRDTDPPQRGELKISGLPAGIKSTFSAAAGINSFNSTLTLFDAGVANGTYNATVEVLTAGGGVFASLPLPITISGEANCAAYFISRKYEATSSCNGGAPYPVYFSRLGSSEDTVLLQNFKNDGTALKFPIACSQTRGGVEISSQIIGSGLEISYYLIDQEKGYPDTIEMRLVNAGAGGAPQYCNYTLRLKP